MVKEYFYKLLTSKQLNWDNSTDKEKFLYGIKYFAALGLFLARDRYYALIGWITNYYPFSLLFHDRLFHAQNKPYRTFMEKLEKTAEQSDIKIFILSGHGGNQTTEFYGKFINRSRNKDGLLKSLEKVLQSKFGTIYARQEKNELRIIIPTYTLNQIIYKD